MKNSAKRLLRAIKRKVGGSEALAVGNPASPNPVDDRNLFLSGQIAARQLRGVDKIRNFRDVEFSVFSQFGEDGIIEWLVERLAIRENKFVEFGVETYREANTRFLAMNRAWRGLVMDGSTANMEQLRSTDFHWRYDVQAVDAFITVENINQLLGAAGFDRHLGLLSVDIDGNDYWVLEAIERLDCALLILEVNPIFGDVHELTVPYNPEFSRFDLHESGLCFGASLMAMRSLAEKRGYHFLGTCSNGINAFFVRNDLFPWLDGAIEEFTAWPALHRDSRDAAGNLTFARGLERWELLKGVTLVDVKEGREVRLGDLQNAFSREWLDAMG